VSLTCVLPAKIPRRDLGTVNFFVLSPASASRGLPFSKIFLWTSCWQRGVSIFGSDDGEEAEEIDEVEAPAEAVLTAIRSLMEVPIRRSLEPGMMGGLQDERD